MVQRDSEVRFLIEHPLIFRDKSDKVAPHWWTILPQICVLVLSIQTALPWISLSISFSTTDLMDIIQDEVTGDSILFKSVIARLCDYVFSGPYSFRGVRIYVITASFFTCVHSLGSPGD